jgi:hypothetical protein
MSIRYRHAEFYSLARQLEPLAVGTRERLHRRLAPRAVQIACEALALVKAKTVKLVSGY